MEFGLKRGNQKVPLSKSTYVTQLKRRLRFAHKKAKQVASRQQARHKGLYDQRCRGAELEIGDLVLVRKTAWKGKHKIQDKCESDENQVIGHPTPDTTVYKVECVAGGGLGFYIETYCCPCKVRSDNQVGWRWKTSKTLMKKRMKMMGCLV